MASKPSITIVGPGRLGRSLAKALASAGYRLREIVFKNPSSLKKSSKLDGVLNKSSVAWQQAHFDADIIWLCVPDAQIVPVASKLKSRTKWADKIVIHSSGALSSDTLDVLRKAGAQVASGHPLMTFVHGSQPALAGVYFALEGDAKATKVASSIIRNLGGNVFPIKKQDKTLYHAWGTFLSPLLLTFVVTAEQIARSIGITPGITPNQARKKMLPIVMQTLANYKNLGPAKSFSGPLVRGDAAIVRAHLHALKKIPEAREVYIALARSALRHLPVPNQKQLQKVVR